MSDRAKIAAVWIGAVAFVVGFWFGRESIGPDDLRGESWQEQGYDEEPEPEWEEIVHYDDAEGNTRTLHRRNTHG